MKAKLEYVPMQTVFDRLERNGFEDWCYYPDSGDLEFLGGSASRMDSTTLDWLKAQGFILQGIWLGCTHKIVFSFRANRLRYYWSGDTK